MANASSAPNIGLVTGPAIGNVSKKKPISVGDIAKELIGADGKKIVDTATEIGKKTIDAFATPVFTGTESLVRATQNGLVAGALSRVATTAGFGGTQGTGTGTPNGRGGNSTIIGNIGGGARGTGEGMQRLATESNLIGNLNNAQFAAGGPGAGFGGMGNILGDMFSGMGKKKKSSDSDDEPKNNTQTTSTNRPPPPPEPGPVPPQTTTNTAPTEKEAQEKLAQGNVNAPLIESYKKQPTDGNNLDENFNQITSIKDNTVIQAAFATFKDQMNNAKNDDKREKALNSLGGTITAQGPEGIDATKVLKQILGIKEEAKEKE